MENKTIAVRLDEKEYFWIQDIARRYKLSKSQVVRNLLISLRTGAHSPILKVEAK